MAGFSACSAASATVVAAAAVLLAFACHQQGVQLLTVEPSLPAAEVATDAAAAAAEPSADRLFSPGKLSIYTAKPLYLAILGDVFDVSTGAQHYARGKSYAHFAGTDASRAFATGDYSKAGLTDDVSGMELEALQSIGDWHKFFMTHETYVRVGRVIGRYYDAAGEPTHAFPWRELERLAAEADERKKRMPDCNSRWSREEGSIVWCTTKSGGIERDWVGVPRIYSEAKDASLQSQANSGGPVGAGEPKPDRCVCLPAEEAASARHEGTPHIIEYVGCAPAAERCKLIKSPK